MAEALGEMQQAITSQVNDGVEFKKAVMEVVKQAIIETKDIRFEGNGYSEEWVDGSGQTRSA